jgi:hypothetical protein
MLHLVIKIKDMELVDLMTGWHNELGTKQAEILQ